MSSLWKAGVIAACVLSASCRTTSSQSKDAGASASSKPADANARTAWSVRMGLSLGNGAGGVLVTRVEPAMFASGIGIVSGDTIFAVNGTRVASATDFDQVTKALAGSTGSTPGWSGVWVLTVNHAGNVVTMQADKAYHCDPYVLVGCGPLRDGGKG